MFWQWWRRKMEDFYSLKDEILQDVEKSKSYDLKKDIIKKILNKSEMQLKSISTEPNHQELTGHINKFFKDEIEKIKKYSDTELTTFLLIEEYNDSSKGTDSLFPFKYEDREFLITWMGENYYSFQDILGDIDKEAFNDLLDVIFEYKSNAFTKALLQPGLLIGERKIKVDRDKKQTVNEAIEAIKERFERCKHDLLIKGATTPKSKELLKLMYDFDKNPNDYFPKIPKINATVDKIRAFLKSKKIPAEDQVSLINYFKYL